MRRWILELGSLGLSMAFLLIPWLTLANDFIALCLSFFICNINTRKYLLHRDVKRFNESIQGWATQVYIGKYTKHWVYSCIIYVLTITILIIISLLCPPSICKTLRTVQPIYIPKVFVKQNKVLTCPNQNKVTN